MSTFDRDDLEKAARYVERQLAKGALTHRHIAILARDFQAAHALFADGAPGPLTIAALDAELAKLEPVAAPAFVLGRPIPEGTRAVVSQGWARPRDGRLHRALDISVPVGTPILAIADGIVVHTDATDNSDAGLWVAVEHVQDGRTLHSQSLHLSEVKVAKGHQVKRGDVLGLSGNTGHSTGPHLHQSLLVPKAGLAHVEACQGKPASGWGEPRSLNVATGYYYIPGEPLVPVDGYRDIVIEDAKKQGIPLRAA